MTVMICTAVAVGIFGFIASQQYKQAYALGRDSDNKGHGSLTSYYLFVFICAAILASVAGLRYGVGSDFGSYYWGYVLWDQEYDQRIADWDEPGLSILARVLHLFTDDGAAFIFLIATITVFLFVFTMAKNTDDFFFAIILYVLTSCWSGCFNGARQYLAAAILFAGHRLIYERKFIKFCLVVFIASSVHITSLIMIPMYFLITKNLDTKKIILIMIAGVALVFSYDLMFELIGVLKDSETGGSDTNYAQTEIHPLRILIAFAPIVLYLIIKLQRTPFTGEENFYMGFLFVRAALIFGTASSAYLNRVGIYFGPYIPLTLCLLVRKFDKKQQLVLKIIVIVLYAVVWIYIDASKIEWQWVFNRPIAFYNKYE